MVVLERWQQLQVVVGLDVDMVAGGSAEAIGEETKDSVGAREGDRYWGAT